MERVERMHTTEFGKAGRAILAISLWEIQGESSRSNTGQAVAE
jgi:hypothetical protein